MTEKFFKPIADRLRGRSDDPDPSSRYAPGGQIVESVRRNIEMILNSRLPMLGDYFLPIPSEGLDASVVNFGVIDFNSVTMDDQTLEARFCKSIKQSLQNYEPRISGVEVHLMKSVANRYIALEISGTLTIHPYENIRVESGYHPEGRRFIVEDK